MIYNLILLPTVFQSDHDNVRVIRKGCVQWTSFKFAFQPQVGRKARALSR